jgi:hypothetical protein
MALNETTGIDGANDRFVVKSIATGQVINMNATWPRADGGQVNGMNPDLQYFIKRDGERPPTDHRFSLDSIYSYTLYTPVPAAGLPVGRYGAEFVPVKLPLPELLTQIDSEYERQVRLQIPQTSTNAAVALVGGLVIRKQSGATLTAEENSLLDQYVDVSNKVAQLRVRYQELIDAATTDEDYDLTVWPVL